MSASAAVDASAPEAEQVPAEETTKEVEAEIATEPAVVADAEVAEEEVSDITNQHENTTIIWDRVGPPRRHWSPVERGSWTDLLFTQSSAHTHPLTFSL